MDLYLRPHSATRAQESSRDDREIKPAEHSEVDVKSPLSLGGMASSAGGDLNLLNCRLLHREGVYQVVIREGLIRSITPLKEGGSTAEGLDLNGSLLLPGFTDSHVHLLPGGERLKELDLEGVTDLEDLTKTLSRFAEDHPKRAVLKAFGLQEGVLDSSRARHQIDKIEKERPVVVMAPDLHTLWVNTKALEVAKLNRSMNSWPEEIAALNIDDLIELDSDKFPTGELREPQCYFLVDSALREVYPTDLEERLEVLQLAVKHLNSHGITTVHNMGLSLPEEDVELLFLAQELERRGGLSLRIHSSYSIVPDQYLMDDVSRAAELRDRFWDFQQDELSWSGLREVLLKMLADFESSSRYGEVDSPQSSFYRTANLSHLKPYEKLASPEPTEKSRLSRKVTMDAVKLFADGVIDQGTAYRSDGTASESIPIYSSDEIEALVGLADRLSLQVRAHCIGDGAVHQMLNAVETARNKNESVDLARGHRIRHRVEHIEICQEQDLERFQGLDVIPSMQPLHCGFYPDTFHQLVSEELWDFAFPWRSLIGAGATLVFSSDWPIAACHCLEGLRHAASRTPCPPDHLDQSLSLKEAARCFTETPPRAVHQEQRIGKIEPGFIADLVVLDTDSLETGKVRATIVDGEIVHGSLA